MAGGESGGVKWMDGRIGGVFGYNMIYIYTYIWSIWSIHIYRVYSVWYDVYRIGILCIVIVYGMMHVYACILYYYIISYE